MELLRQLGERPWMGEPGFQQAYGLDHGGVCRAGAFSDVLMMVQGGGAGETAEDDRQLADDLAAVNP